MRIRSTKPEFWRSERIASVSWDARLVLKGLESFVDDNGVGRDDIALIVGDLFQRDLIQEPSGTLRRVQEAMSELNRAGLLWRYEFEGTRLIYIAFWETAQYVPKPNKGRNPRPDGTFNYKDSAIGASPQEHSGTFRNVPALNRGTEEQVTGEQGDRGVDDLPPAPTCSKHSHWEHEENCRACGNDRRANEAWEAAQAAKPKPPKPHKHRWMPDGTCNTCEAKEDDP